NGQQTWIGSPRVIVQSGTPAATSNAEPFLVVVVPADPPVITFDQAPDGTLTRQPDKKNP
ncbi:MAG: hypothetical protein HQL95_08255, partial [Magnetococcales bacterium]|nr:hypothetical protein [Magnetococcales bacterium]